MGLLLLNCKFSLNSLLVFLTKGMFFKVSASCISSYVFWQSWEFERLGKRARLGKQKWEIMPHSFQCNLVAWSSVRSHWLFATSTLLYLNSWTLISLCMCYFLTWWASESVACPSECSLLGMVALQRVYGNRIAKKTCRCCLQLQDIADVSVFSTAALYCCTHWYLKEKLIRQLCLQLYSLAIKILILLRAIDQAQKLQHVSDWTQWLSMHL